MLVLSFTAPIIAAPLAIAFFCYWILRLFYTTLFLLISYLRLSAEKKTDWMARVRGLDDLEAYLSKLEAGPGLPFWSLKERLSLAIHRGEVRALRKNSSPPPVSGEIYQLVIIPIAKENREIIEPGIASLADGTFPAKRIAVTLAVEARAGAHVKRGVQEIIRKYEDRFYDIRAIFHPDGLPGEARVKGANVTCAAREMTQFFRSKKILFEHVIVSCFDADTVVDAGYFACVTYQYLVCPDRNYASFQPIPVYNNNIWQARSFARVLEMGASFFQLIEATNPEKLVTFSSHSMSFKALVDVGYWACDMISDDSAIFWKAYIHYDGRYRVVPVYVTLSMDVVDAGKWWKTMVNIYRQKRRWAWGVENFPVVMRAFLKADRISVYDKVRHGFKLFEGHIAWATWAFLLSVVGWLPALFARREFSETVLYYSAPRISGIIFNLSSIALIVSIFLSIKLLPRANIKFSFFKQLVFALQWLMMPIVFIFLSALPALDAQTRLMLGKYMEFWVTDKKR